MRLIKHFTTTLFAGVLFTTAAFSQIADNVDTYATDPALPLIDQAVTIYVNVNHYDITDLTKVTAYTGTVTTASDSRTGWRNVKNSDWSDISLEMTMENDSVYSFTVDDINAFYGVPAEEEVFRLTFIARGSTGEDVSGQTSDLFIDVFKESPTTIMSYMPMNATDTGMIVVTWNINDTETPSRNDLAGYADTAYVHTWGFGTVGTIVGPNWGDNVDEWMCETVNDSIRRYFYSPTVRSLMQFSDDAAVDSLGILIRNKAADGQTNDFVINLSSSPAVDPGTGIAMNELEGVLVYPNPASDVLYIQFEQEQEASITFFNAVGQVMHRHAAERSSMVTIDLNEFTRSESMIFYRIEAEGKVSNGKLMLR